MAAAVKTTVTELPESRVRVEAEVPPTEVQKSVERAARTLGRDLRMPGFRRGKVPPPVVIQRFGRETVLDEAVRGQLGQWYLDEIGVRPTALLGEYKGVEVPRREAQAGEEAVQAELDQLRERSARLETVEQP